jgi:L-galactose dehydrogenase
MAKLKPNPQLGGVMRYRRLGQTDLNISVAGFGASPLGGVFGPYDEQEGTRAVHLAVEEGINFFDVSPYYGLTLAEERLGQALAGHRDKVILATKCGRYGRDDFDFSAKRVRLSVEESLRRLRTDYVDLLLAHDVEFGDTNLIIGETIPAMRRLQEEGKARFVGISGYPLLVLMTICRRIPVDCILSYCRYNLLIDDMDTVLTPFATNSGIGLINAAPLHMGMLSKAGAPGWHPAPAQVRKAVSEAIAFCERRNVDLSEVGLRFCFAYPHVTSTLVGISTSDQVRKSLAALNSTTDPGLLREIQDILAPAANVVWPSGRPDNHDPIAQESLPSTKTAAP